MNTLKISYYDNKGQELGTIGDHLSAKVQYKRNDVGSAQIKLPADSPHAQRLKELAPTPNKPHGDVVPIRFTYNNQHWTGRAFNYIESGVPGDKTLTVDCVSDWYHMKSLLAWPSPGMPLAVQLFKRDQFIGPIDVSIARYLRRNANRYNLPLEIIQHDEFDFTNFFELSNFVARMTPMDELFKDELKDHEANVELYLWLPGDPQPKGKKLTEPTLVMEIRKSQPNNVVRWNEDEGAGIRHTRVAGKTSTAAHIIVGGKSYDFVNNLVSLGINAAINAAFGAVGLGPVGNIITSEFDDILFAFNQYNNWETVNNHGPFYFREAYQNGGAGGFTAEAAQAGRQGIYEHKARTNARFEVIDGLPWSFGTDYKVGEKVRAKISGKWHEQIVNSVEVTETRADGIVVTPTIGDDDIGEDATARLIRRGLDTFQFIKAFALAG